MRIRTKESQTSKEGHSAIYNLDEPGGRCAKRHHSDREGRIRPDSTDMRNLSQVHGNEE